MKRFIPLMFLAALAAPACKLLESTSKKSAPPPTTARSAPAPTSTDRNQNYVNQYATAAIAESKTGGVPASITLAQGILESGAGTSELAQNANNHFGIKCGGGWTGKTYMKKDDDKDASGKIVESCFRKYDKVEESYLDHAAFLRDPKKQTRYGFLFQLDPTDYKGWARGLQSSGYSTSSTYADKLIDIIERYQLYQYDQPGAGVASAVPNPENPQAGAATDANIPLPNSKNRVGRVNNVRVILARDGETLTDIAKVYRLSADKLAQYNDWQYTPIQKLKVNTRVFIQSKKDKWNGTNSEHTVKNNETMFDIAQLYGVKLDKILQRNRLSRAQQPAVGERIYLNAKRPTGNEVALRDDVPTGITGQPAIGMPTTTAPVSLTPNEDELLDEIGGGEQNKPQQAPATTIPASTTPASTPPTTSPSTNPFAAPPATTPPPTTTAPPATTISPGPAVSGTAFPAGESTGAATTPAATQPSPAPATVPDGYHLVVKGDTLFSIARKYNITTARLKELNNMTDDSVKLGQVLKVK